MTNAQIILMESVKLMRNGIIKGSGVKGITPDGRQVELPEEIHTYQRWKSLGYQVQKGQKSVAQFPIWKYTKKKSKEMTEEEAQQSGYCFMKMSSFFTAEQVEKIQDTK